MKNIKKILAILVVAMIVAASMAAYAADPDTKITITGLQAGDTVYLYKIVNWVGTQADHSDVAGWKATSDYTIIASSAELAKMIDSGDANYTGITSDLAGKLARLASDTTKVDQKTLDSGTYEYTIPANANNDNLGVYMALVKPADDDTVYNPVFVSADWNMPINETNAWSVTEESSYYGAQGAAKKSQPELEKDSSNDKDSSGDNGDTTKPGDTITFTVTTTIPGFGDVFETPQFILSDTMDSLTFDQGSLKIKLEDNTAIDDKYTLSEGDDGFTATFKTDWLKTLDVPTKITATYTAKVNDLGKNNYTSVDREYNTVQVGYSHDPSWKPSGEPGTDNTEPLKYKKDITNHYTFSIDAKNLGHGEDQIGESATEIIKVAVDRQGNPIYESKSTISKISKKGWTSPLAGAEFKLVGNGKEYTATSDADGRILFEGLDEGTYTLTETKAPDGFVRDTDPHTIVIDATLKEKEYTEYYDQKGNWYDEAAEGRTEYKYKADELESYTITFDGAEVASHTFAHQPNASSEIKWSSSGNTEAPSSIHNTVGVELPSTGGIGTTIFYVGGSILVLAAAILLVTKRRMSVEE